MSTASHAEGDLADHIVDDELDSSASGTLSPLTADDLLLDYIKSRLANPHKALTSSDSRSAFIFSLLGDTSLAKEAQEDESLLRQLESRVGVLVNYIAATIPSVDEFVTDAFVALLAHVAARWPVLLEVMERENVSVVVINTMRHFNSHAAIAARCLTALRAFAVTDSMRKRVMFDGGVDVTLNIMSTHQHDLRVQDRAAAVISNVAFGCPHRKRRIARQGGIKKIVDGMSAFPDDENIQLRGALTIRNLSYGAQVNQYIAGNQGAVEAVAATMLRFRGSSGNPELRFQCVMALESLCREDEHNRQRLVDIDSSIPSVRPFSCSVPPVPSKSACNTTKEYVNEEGDVVVDEEEVLLSELSTNFHRGSTLCPGRMMTVSTGSPSSPTNEEREEVFFGVTKDFPAALPQQRIDMETQDSQSGIQAESRETSSVIRAIIHAVCRDPDDHLLLETGLSLLTLISINRPAVQIRVGDLNGIQVAVAAIRRYPKRDAIVIRGCALLRCLCMQKSNRDKVTSGLLVLISVARDNGKNPNVTREAIAALGNAVFRHERNRSWVIDKGGIAAIVRTMHVSGDTDAMGLEAAVCALRNIVHASHNGALLAAKEGAIRATVFALDQTKNAVTIVERIVQEQAVRLLADIVRLVPQAKEEMKHVGAVDWVENTLAKLSVDQFPDLHDEGDDLIAALSSSENGKRRSCRNPEDREPDSAATGSERRFARGILSGFFSARWKKLRPKSDVRRRLAGHSMPIERETGRTRRLSARFLKRTVSP